MFYSTHAIVVLGQINVDCTCKSRKALFLEKTNSYIILLTESFSKIKAGFKDNTNKEISLIIIK